MLPLSQREHHLILCKKELCLFREHCDSYHLHFSSACRAVHRQSSDKGLRHGIRSVEIDNQFALTPEGFKLTYEATAGFLTRTLLLHAFSQPIRATMTSCGALSSHLA